MKSLVKSPVFFNICVIMIKLLHYALIFRNL